MKKMNFKIEKKTSIYVTLFLGLCICLITFFGHIQDFAITGNIRITEFAHHLLRVDLAVNDYKPKIFDMGRGSIEIKIIWFILLFSFIYYWWRLRFKISEFLKKIHNKI